MQTSAELRRLVERFVADATEPALLDPGEEPLRLLPDRWSVSEWNGRVIVQAWDTRRNLVRKILGLREQKRDRLCLLTERFPKREAEMQIADLAAPLGKELERKTLRMAFRDRFRLMLSREFPNGCIEEITSETNLEQSLPPTFVRAFVTQGAHGMALLAAPPGGACGGIIAVGLIWLDYLRRREKAFPIPRLLLYVPAEAAGEVSSRAALLDPARVRCDLYVFDEMDRTGHVDFEDGGNLASLLPACKRPVVPNSEPPVFPDMPGVDHVTLSDGGISLRVHGLEFARWSGNLTLGSTLWCGIGRRRRGTMATVAALASEVARVRRGDAEDMLHPLYTQYPEGWLESQIRAGPQVIDAGLLPGPLYGQVPVFGAPDRGILDLLGVDYTGQLVVIEIKATADLQLPFQALDYWLRVRQHLLAGDFERLGYFPGVPLRRVPPRVLLVAPALEFHSTSEALLGYLSPQVEITRVGLGAGWRQEPRVMFRLRGSERPSGAEAICPPSSVPPYPAPNGAESRSRGHRD